MGFWEILGIILGGGAVAALINKAGDFIISRTTRQDVRQDRQEERQILENDRYNNTEKKLEELEKLVAEVIESQRQLVKVQDSQTIAQRASISERLFYLCQVYLKREKIHYEERRRLISLHDAYEGVGGNGDFDDLIERVMKLELIMD